MNSMKKKALAFAAAACAFGMLLSGCGSSNGDSTADKGSNVITAYNSEPQNPLIPGDCNETGGGKPLDLLFARLISFDAKGNASNEVAESIKSNDDATQYTIKLKDGWKFTDGTPVTAESFTKAWSYTANAKNAQLGSSFFSTIKGLRQAPGMETSSRGDEQLEGLKVVNDHEFTVDLNRSDSVFAIKVGYTAFAPLPESFFKDPKAFGEKPVGNGPYKFQSWDHDNQIVLVKNPDYKATASAKNDGVTSRSTPRMRPPRRHPVRFPRRDGVRPGLRHPRPPEGLHRTGLQQGRLRHPAVHHPGQAEALRNRHRGRHPASPGRLHGHQPREHLQEGAQRHRHSGR